MKLITDYAYNNEGKKALIGYWLEAENETEEHQLNSIRNQIFFGLPENGTKPQYAGRHDNKETDNVKSLGWIIPNNITRYNNGEICTKELSEYTDYYIKHQ